MRSKRKRRCVGGGRGKRGLGRGVMEEGGGEYTGLWIWEWRYHKPSPFALIPSAQLSPNMYFPHSKRKTGQG